MKKLILHIEWGDGIQLSSEELEGYLSAHIGDLFGNLEHEDEDSPDVGWRWFSDLDAALDWETGRGDDLNCPDCDGPAHLEGSLIVCRSGHRTVVTEQMQSDVRASLINAVLDQED